MEQFKNEVFERIGKEWFRGLRSVNKAKNAGEKEAANMIFLQALGLLDAIEAMGFDVEEFTTYYKANRKRYREELIEQEV